MDFEFNGSVFDDTARRRDLADSRYNGIDYLEVDTTPGETNQRILRVYFIAPGPTAPADKVTTMLADLDGNSDAFIIKGGTRVHNVRVIQAQRVEDHIELLVDRPGDFSDYQLRTPFVLLWPGKAPQKYPQPSSHEDFVPTLMQHALGCGGACCCWRCWSQRCGCPAGARGCSRNR